MLCLKICLAQTLMFNCRNAQHFCNHYAYRVVWSPEMFGYKIQNIAILAGDKMLSATGKQWHHWEVCSKVWQLQSEKQGAVPWRQWNLAKLKGHDCLIRVWSESIVRDLGVHLDEEPTMKQHIAKIAASCFYHLHHLRQIHQRVGTEVITWLAGIRNIASQLLQLHWLRSSCCSKSKTQLCG